MTSFYITQTWKCDDKTWKIFTSYACVFKPSARSDITRICQLSVQNMVVSCSIYPCQHYVLDNSAVWLIAITWTVTISYMILWIVHQSFCDRRPLGLHVLNMAPYIENTCLLRHQHGLSGLLILAYRNHLESYSHKLVFVLFVEICTFMTLITQPYDKSQRGYHFCIWFLVLLNSVNGDDIFVLHYKANFIA
jgi:hypothetical protein